MSKKESDQKNDFAGEWAKAGESKRTDSDGMAGLAGEWATATGKSAPSALGDLRAQLDEARKQADENLNLAKYKQAELENYIKRQKDAVANAFTDGRVHVIMNVLPVLDNIAEAQKVIQNENDRQGVEILQRKFEGILEGMGLEEIETKVGDDFDPYIHNCVSSSEGNTNKILAVWQKGYKFAGRVIRPVAVKI